MPSTALGSAARPLRASQSVSSAQKPVGRLDSRFDVQREAIDDTALGARLVAEKLVRAPPHIRASKQTTQTKTAPCVRAQVEA